MFKRSLLSVAAIFSLLIVGCETIKEAMHPKDEKDKAPRYVITLHQIVKYPRASDLERQITAFDGRKYWINMNQFFHSRHIEEVKLVPSKEREGYFDVLMKLDPSGIMKWVQLSMHFKREKMAMLIDGHFYELYTPDQLADENDEWVLLRGPFDKVTAGGIKKYANKNFLFFNPNKQGFNEFIESLNLK